MNPHSQQVLKRTTTHCDRCTHLLLICFSWRFSAFTFYLVPRSELSLIHISSELRIIQIHVCIILHIIYIYITLFHQLNGSIKIQKSTLINITQQKKKEKKNKQYLTLMFGYQPTQIIVRRTVLFQKCISTKGNRLF